MTAWLGTHWVLIVYLAGAMVLVLGLWLGGVCAPGAVSAQTPTLTLAHLNPENDLELDFAALVLSYGNANAGGQNLYAIGGWGTNGSLADGDLDYGTGGGSLARIRTLNDNTGLRLNGPQSGATVDLRTAFNGSGERSSASGWSFHLMWSATGDRVELDSFSAGSSNAMNVDLAGELTSAQLTSWRSVGNSDRFILALARDNPSPPAITGVTSRVTTTGAVLQTTITNPSSALVTLHCRYRAEGAAAWTSCGTVTTTGTTARITLSGLTPGASYEAEVSVTSAYAAESTTRNTFATAVGAAITRVDAETTETSADITVNWANPDGENLTVHLDVTGEGATHQFQVTPSPSTTSHTFTVTGLTAHTTYTAAAAFSPAPSTDSSAFHADFNTARGSTSVPNQPPTVGIRHAVCLGDFPGCPDSYQFILPTVLLGVLIRKGPKRLKKAEALGVVWLVSFIVLTTLLQTDPLRVLAYVVGALMAGAIALALRR